MNIFKIENFTIVNLFVELKKQKRYATDWSYGDFTLLKLFAL